MITAYDYDDAYRLMSAQTEQLPAVDYEWDANGNLLETNEARLSNDDIIPSVFTDTVYVYNYANRLVQLEKTITYQNDLGTIS